MGTNPGTQLENLRDRIEISQTISEADRESLEDFDHRLTLMKTTYSTHRHVKLLRHVTIMAEEIGGVAKALVNRDAAERIVGWIHKTYDNEETNSDYRVALKVFGRRVSDENDDEPPSSLSWFRSGTSRNYDPSPEPKFMLDWKDEVLSMIDETHNPRDAAAIALQFDAGLRGFEFTDLTYGDITDHEHGLQVTVDGKKGKRTVTLIPSVPYVEKYRAVHHGQDIPDAPFWCELNSPEEISYKMKTKMFSEPANRADISKPVTLTNFRKSSASYLASKGLNQAHLEDHHGWVRGSKAAARYITIFGKDGDRELAKIYGLEIADGEPERLAPVICPRCGKKTPRERDLCVWCGQALQPGAAEKADALDTMIVESLADASEEDSKRLLEFRDTAKNDPELRAEAISQIEGLLDAD